LVEVGFILPDDEVYSTKSKELVDLTQQPTSISSGHGNDALRGEGIIFWGYGVQRSS
jgi:hypothetical protein